MKIQVTITIDPDSAEGLTESQAREALLFSLNDKRYRKVPFAIAENAEGEEFEIFIWGAE